MLDRISDSLFNLAAGTGPSDYYFSQGSNWTMTAETITELERLETLLDEMNYQVISLRKAIGESLELAVDLEVRSIYS